MRLEIIGAADEVTGSCHLLEVGGRRLLLDCGLIQGRPKDEARNREPFPFDPEAIDAVILSHAHIDHSGRIPLLVKRGFRGPIFTQAACRDLCRIMLKDAAFLNEREAEWDNRKRERKGLPRVEPLYTRPEAHRAMRQFKTLPYGERRQIVPGVSVQLLDAGHILGSSIVELWLEEGKARRKLVYSGDLGHNGAPIVRDVSLVAHADLLLMESTYGDRFHRPLDETLAELAAVLHTAFLEKGNVLVPSFAVGRSQALLMLFAKFFDQWHMDQWSIFLDSPLAIEATEIYLRHSDLYDEEAASLWRKHREHSRLPNLHICRTANQSMQLNTISSGAIIIAGSGMCNGGRIKHHLKHNVWREDCHIIISGFQAKGTIGRSLVDGARYIRLWGETVRVAAKVHTIGGLSAHADQGGLLRWYGGFDSAVPVVLVHGEREAQQVLAERLRETHGAPVRLVDPGDRIDLRQNFRK